MKAKSVNESLGDILKPKPREEVTRELDKLSLDQKIEAIDSYYYNKGELLNDLDEIGADTRKIVESILKQASREELIDIIGDLLDVSTESHIIEFILSIIDDKKYDSIFKDYVTAESKAELNDIVNDLLMRHTDIVADTDLFDEDEEWDEDEYGNIYAA